MRTQHCIAIVATAVWIQSWPALAQPPTRPSTPAQPTVTAVDRTTSIPVGQRTFTLVTHVQQIGAPQKPTDETVEWWELRDPNGVRVYRQAYPFTVRGGGFDTTTSVTAEPLQTKLGSGMLIEVGEEPSAPNGGNWVQVFGERYGPTTTGPLTAFGPPMSTDGEWIDIATDPRRPTPPEAPGRTVIVMNDILRFRIWTGNLSILYPVSINWIAGSVAPAWRCFRGRIERCAYPIKVEPNRPSEMTFVRLFPEPDPGFTPGHVVVQPTSKIDYLEAEAPVRWDANSERIFFAVPDPGEVWLKIRIDGQEGWIHSEEDFQAVGLPQAG
jgi:hypothetical protein